MAKITLKGQPFNTSGELPNVGSQINDCHFTKTDLSEVSIKDFLGQKIVLNIFPSLDTPTCATSVRKFNEHASSLKNTVVLCISADLPFAQQRFCSIEKLDRVIGGSVFRHPEFGLTLGITITDGPLKGLLARSVLVVAEDGKIIYNELVNEVANEPDYESALAALN